MFIVPDARSEVGVEESKENVANWTTVVTPTKRPAAAAAKSASVHVFHASVERRRGVSECPVLPETVWIRRCCSRRWWRRRTTQHEVNDIYTCFPPGPLTRSAITTAVESARAPGPSLSPSPSPRRDASTRPLRESNRSPVPVIVTPLDDPPEVSAPVAFLAPGRLGPREAAGREQGPQGPARDPGLHAATISADWWPAAHHHQHAKQTHRARGPWRGVARDRCHTP